MNEIGEVSEKRRYQRLELKVDVIVRTDSALLPGRTQDISECGMSAILPVELREGQEVELQIKLPSATQTVRAIVRHRNVFRHGFEFVQPLHGIVRNEAEPIISLDGWFSVCCASLPKRRLRKIFYPGVA